ncbi:hypothetical protein [Streptomyces alboflavus]|uniref:hypothetical protein n=1 Tax=Streptomyces alboflavus TaxID=67267 RepID=UPI00369D1FE8
MDLLPYVDHLRRELSVAADADGDEARARAERPTAQLEPATRLTLLRVVEVGPSDVLSRSDLGAAEPTRVAYGQDRLLIRAPRRRGLFGPGAFVDVTVEPSELPEGNAEIHAVTSGGGIVIRHR